MTTTIDRERPESCLSDLLLDRILLGELAVTGTIDEHLASCAACRAQLAQLRSRQEAFAVAAPPPPSLARPRHWRRRIAWGGVSTALASAAVVALLLHRPPSPPLRNKGGFGLELIARHADGQVESVLPGALLAPGDAVRFRLSTHAAGHLVILGLDAAGHVTAYAPSEGTSLDWPAGDAQLVDGSIRLDATPGSERIVALLCARPIDVATAVAAGTRALVVAHGDPRAVSGDLGLGCASASTWFAKPTR